MELDYYTFTAQDNTETTIGLNIQKQYGLTHVNMFAINENKGAQLGKNLFLAAQSIIEEVLPHENLENVQWSYVAGDRVCRVNFSNRDRDICEIYLSDTFAFQYENSQFEHKHANYTKTLDEYSDYYVGHVPTRAERIKTLRYPEENETIFQVPYSISNEHEGLFYCVTPYINTPHMKDNYQFVLADTKKVIQQLLEDNPDLLEHGKRQKTATASEMTHWNSIRNPHDMGAWEYSENTGLQLIGGDAATLILMQELNLPCFPMQFHKNQDINEMKKRFGYHQTSDNTPHKSMLSQPCNA